MLRDLPLKAVYRSDEDNILEDFYVPALSESVSYQRAVGFFSAAMLSCAAQGLSVFVSNGGKIQLIVGGEMTAEDEEALQKGYDLRAVSERLGLELSGTIESVADQLCYRRLETLSWLVATGHLELKVALRKKGMYHEKIGILHDANGDAVIFQGSANETAYALLPEFNFESINVFQGWREEFRSHFEPYVRGFVALWENRARDTLVIPFPEAARRKLIAIAEKCPVPRLDVEIELARRDEREREDITPKGPSVPTLLNGQPFQMKEHQTKALIQWQAADFKGIFAHATGSGKTITAIYGAIRLFRATGRLVMVVCVPYQNLADQWIDVLDKFGISGVPCYASQERWKEELAERLSLFLAGAIRFLCIVVVNKTLQNESFQSQLKAIPSDCMLWVGDECHHHTTRAIAPFLPVNARMRLGLSATPEHYLDSDATSRLKQFYGEVVSQFTLEEALSAGVVTPYDYHVSIITLTDAETEAYLEVSQRIAAAAASMGSSLDSEAIEDNQLKALLARRSRILGSATHKLLALRAMLARKRPEPLTLFYCGDGSVEDEDSGEAVRNVQQVSQLLYELGWKCSHFTAREPRAEREKLLASFRIGAIDALVAIRCLDEGIDVPACRMAFLLASGRNPRQFVQRRGRILRRSAGKSLAVIHDFLTRLPDAGLLADSFERRLVSAEMKRVSEFARLANNSAEVVRELLPLLKEYDLAHLLA